MSMVDEDSDDDDFPDVNTKDILPIDPEDLPSVDHDDFPPIKEFDLEDVPDVTFEDDFFKVMSELPADFRNQKELSDKLFDEIKIDPDSDLDDFDNE